LPSRPCAHPGFDPLHQRTTLKFCASNQAQPRHRGTAHSNGRTGPRSLGRTRTRRNL
jgi:hypothetical protein